MDETTILGYRIEKLAEEPGRYQPAYFLHGPRGALYGLMRNLHRPEFL